MEVKLTLQTAMHENPLIEQAFKFPEGIDREKAIKGIVFYNYQKPLLHGDIDALPWMVQTWCELWETNFKHLLKVYETDYNPIDNYDGEETHTWTEIGTNSQSGRSNGTSENDVMAYDSSDYSHESKNTSDGNSETNGEFTTTHTETLKKHGNLGVTTTSQMQMQAQAFESENNLYKTIAEMFSKEFCYYYSF